MKCSCTDKAIITFLLSYTVKEYKMPAFLKAGVTP